MQSSNTPTHARIPSRARRRLFAGGLKAIAGAAVATGAATWLPAPALAAGDAWPSRPVTVVVGFAPGGPTDIVARLIASKLEASLGQPVVVENKPGAGSNIGSEYAVRAKPDGYTLLVMTIANATNMSMYRNMKYDTKKDLVPIVQTMASPSVLVVNPKVPAKTVQELVALAKAQPGKLSFASSGAGGSPHLAGELLKLRAGIDMIHVPYKGASPAMADVIAGHVDSGFKTSLAAMPNIKAGKMRALAVAAPKRLADLPDVPTMEEAGFPKFFVVSWNGLAAPAGTPAPIVERLNAEVNKVLADPEVRKKMETLGAEPIGGSAQAFAKYIGDEIDTWAEVVKKAGIALD
ncbi:MAG: Bug family tripartite tricarboxylate transporter substrate binding protein [Lautropia sp.]